MPSQPTSRTSPAKKKAKDPRDTPAMRQHRRFKEAHPDCILFFRMGDFYEMFDEDALTVHRTLGLTLTERTSGIPMAGVPFHAAEGYIHRLIGEGFRVAVCDQIQDPSEAKGVVDRAVTRVLTPGTLVDESLLEEGRSNATALVTLSGDGTAVIAIAELSTGRFELLHTGERDVVDTLARLAPCELLVSEALTDHPVIMDVARVCACVITPRPPWSIDPSEGRHVLCDHWGVATLEGWGLADDVDGIAAAGGLLRFLLDTMPGEHTRLSHMQPPISRDDSDRVCIDASTLRHLEVEQTIRTGGVDGSLLDALRCCVSPMGRRLLRDWLCWPLANRSDIEARHDLVAALVADDAARADLVDTVGRVQDVARIAGRAATGRLTPRDATALGRSVLQLPALRERLEVVPAAADIAAEIASLESAMLQLGEDIRTRCVDDPPAHLREGGCFRAGVDDELDAARLLQRDGSAWLARYQAELSDTTGIPSLKVGYNRVFGYYIEVTHIHADRVPPHFVRKQTLKNAERYITDRLKTYESEALGAQARGIEREQAMFADLVERIDAAASFLRELAAAVAKIDVLCGFAGLAVTHSLVRPTMTDGCELDIRDGRHPVLDTRLGSDFVPNDCLTTPDGCDRTPLLLITGPNMAGKSTYIRQVALIALMAQAGCFVPASAATLGVTDRIFARIGASDELHAGMSTFMVEMTETANILHNATARSLVILDEIGRGTSTLDGLSLAWAITERLAAIGCRTLFATHYHELTDLGERCSGIGNRHVAVQEWDDRIVFLHRIKPGATNRSYGVHVGRLAGLPPSVIERAQRVLDSLEVHHATDEVPPAASDGIGQLGLFTQYVEHPALERLREIDLDRLSPMDAFDALRTLRMMLDDSA